MRGIAEMNHRFIKEIDEVGEKTLTKQWVVPDWSPPKTQFVRINFNATYDCRQYRSASRMVAQNDKGEVLVSKSTLNIEVASPFATEACACAQAVRLGLAMGVKKIETKGDTLTIITKCQSTAIEKLKIDMPWSRWDLEDKENGSTIDNSFKVSANTR
ncbi:hypothetical protein Gogos_003469 [Gossypium gossypioides]|uniref:RNase H type-1 domain-containing protein n=1 Tax=Gossypium gossypioides TaxID=34282 RepID=A0A7J9CM52_GOSGO|nr:hypothetical protein [Gossypium gossypioides]